MLNNGYPLLFLVCLLVLLLVSAFIVYSILAHRKSQRGPVRSFHASWMVELVWALIPLCIIVLAVLPALERVF